MPRVSRRGKRVKGRRRRTRKGRRKTGSLKLMKSVARRVALNLSEAKRFTTLNELPFGGAGVNGNTRWSYRNVFAVLPSSNGAISGTSFAIDGNEIVDPMIKFKSAWRLPYWNILETPEQVNSYSTMYMWIYLVAVNDQLSSTIPPSPTWTGYPAQYSSTDPGWFLTQDGVKPTLNGNNVRVIRRWHKKYTPENLITQDITGAATVGHGTVTISIHGKHKFRGKKTFEDAVFADTDSNFLRSTVLRGWNYYFLVGWGGTGSLTFAQQPQCNLDTFCYWKDP